MSGAAPCPRPSMMVSGTVLYFYIYPAGDTDSLCINSISKVFLFL